MGAGLGELHARSPYVFPASSPFRWPDDSKDDGQVRRLREHYERRTSARVSPVVPDASVPLNTVILCRTPLTCRRRDDCGCPRFMYPAAVELPHRYIAAGMAGYFAPGARDPEDPPNIVRGYN